MIGKFSEYTETDFEYIALDENSTLFGESCGPFQAGFGHGFIFGSGYCNDTGNGIGKGYGVGNGYMRYPHSLIQYWE